MTDERSQQEQKVSGGAKEPRDPTPTKDGPTLGHVLSAIQVITEYEPGRAEPPKPA
jgi:hypothetical protein